MIETPRIDSHAHVFSRECRAVAGARYRPDYAALAPDWTALWPQAGVTHGVLVQPSFLGTDNAYLLQQLRAQSERLRGVAVVAPGIERARLREWDAAGVRGIRLNLIGVTDLGVYAVAEWRTLFAAIAELEWHIEIQCEGERLAELLGVLDAPSPALVFDHFGLPDPQAQGACAGVAAMLDAASGREVFVKLSAPYRLRGADARHYAKRYLAELGARRLLWGSDWPWTNHEAGRDYGACARWLDGWVTDAASRRTIAWETPRRLYRFSARP